jgi:hypothetical protein
VRLLAGRGDVREAAGMTMAARGRGPIRAVGAAPEEVQWGGFGWINVRVARHSPEAPVRHLSDMATVRQSGHSGSSGDSDAISLIRYAGHHSPRAVQPRIYVQPSKISIHKARTPGYLSTVSNWKLPYSR